LHKKESSDLGHVPQIKGYGLVTFAAKRNSPLRISMTRRDLRETAQRSQKRIQIAARLIGFEKFVG
jgi:hypothetical protein